MAHMKPHSISRQLPDLTVCDHEFDVPLDHAHPGGETIRLFAREVTQHGKADAGLPWLLFLQGGPGFPSPRPVTCSGWIRRATEQFRVLLLDQRGTGRSTPVTQRSLAARGDARAQADWLAHFRADSIVRDAELLRHEWLGGKARWTLLGQSYGGFCSLHYLSAAPEGLAGALITGGLPPLEASAEEVYRHTYPRVLDRNRIYYERYPEDVERVRAITTLLEAGDVRLPSGDRLTKRRFQSLGGQLGFSDGFETLHYLVEEAFAEGSDGFDLSYGFLRGFENALHFDTNPIYALLHEACYTQGSASRWAAERVRAEFPIFDAEDGPFLFTGEMIYPWMFEDIGVLRPLRETAELLAQHEDWPELYDRTALETNKVPVAAAVYYDDMYVDRELSLATARAVPRVKTWITNEYDHNGLRADGERLLDRLLALLASA